MKAIVVLGLLAACAAPVSAQTWSREQQEIIEQIRRCNDGWVASIEEKRFQAYGAVCPETRNALFWYPGSAKPAPYGGPDGVWSQSSAQNRTVSWHDMRPVTVQVDGDLAFIYYAVTWIVEANTGETRRAPSHRLTVFQRLNGRWLMAGGTIAAAN